jgi:catalase
MVSSFIDIANVLCPLTTTRSTEADPSEYEQVRELYRRVMTSEQRKNLHKNTAILLKVGQLNRRSHADCL